MRLIVIAALFFCHATLVSIAQDKKPAHVIIIMADQLRYDVIGSLTPNISQLMSEATTFDRAYCTSPICAPSRASFFTGLYPNQTGSLINPWEDRDIQYGQARKGIPNLYSLLESKWDSHHVGKQHFFSADSLSERKNSGTRWTTQKDYTRWMKEKKVEKPGGPEFKAIVPELVSGQMTHPRSYSAPVVKRYDGGIDYFLDHYIGNEVINAIRNRDKKKPLLLNAMFLAPHPPFHIPEPYFSMIPDSSVQLPENVGRWYNTQSPLQLYNITGFIGTRYTREQWRFIWSKYLGLVRLLDDEVGRIIKALKEEGLYDESIIVFTADHGEMLGSHSLWQKMCMYEESAKVPLVIKFPDDAGYDAAHISTPVSLVDVFPTLLEYNGVPLPTGLDGKSLLSLVMPANRRSGELARPVFIQYDGNGALGNFQRCIVKGNDKLIIDIFRNDYFIEWYDVVNDPQEKTNLIFRSDISRDAQTLIDELKQHMHRTRDHIVLPEDILDQFLANYKNLLTE